MESTSDAIETIAPPPDSVVPTQTEPTAEPTADVIIPVVDVSPISVDLDQVVSASGPSPHPIQAPPPQAKPARPTFPSSYEAIIWLEQQLVAIDELITEQVNELLHHPQFQKLEARWRGLEYLVDQLGSSEDEHAEIIISILDVDWRRLGKDLEFASDYTQSQLFRMIYDDEFGSPGGKPFGLLLGDFEIGAGRDDLSALRSISRTAAAAFAPFVAQAHPSLLGLDQIRDLQRQLDLRIRFESPEMRRWNDLRGTEESRFVGLTLPRVLIRLPYVDDGSLDHGFRFAEDLSADAAGSYCWAGGIWALGGVAIRAFQESGWFADMRGIRRGQRGGGLVEGLIAPDYGTDAPGVACRAPLDIAITDEIEHELAGNGFICLCPNGDSGDAAFYTIPSLSRLRKNTDQASANSNVSAMLPYMLCVCRFAHALKVIARNNIGSTQDQATLRAALNKWIRRFVIEGSSSSAEQRARFPLSEAEVELEAIGNSGNFSCVMRLVPHLQFEAGAANVQLKTVLEAAR